MFDYYQKKVQVGNFSQNKYAMFHHQTFALYSARKFAKLSFDLQEILQSYPFLKTRDIETQGY